MTEPHAGTWPPPQPADHVTPSEQPLAASEPAREEATDSRAGEFDLGVTVTGHAGVDAALSRLGELGALPTADHVEVYERVHADLHEVLSELDGNQP
jgi:hypothetical protein